MAEKTQQSNGSKPEGAYIVLRQEKLNSRSGDQEVVAWVPVSPSPYTAKTGDDAKRKAAAGLDLTTTSGEITLVAVPAKSFKPTTARVVIPEPKLVLS